MKPLTELLHDLEQEMLKLDYSKGSLKFYGSRWRKLLQFARDQSVVYYTERAGIDFVEKYYSIFRSGREKNLKCL